MADRQSHCWPLSACLLPLIFVAKLEKFPIFFFYFYFFEKNTGMQMGLGRSTYPLHSVCHYWLTASIPVYYYATSRRPFI